MTLVALSYKLPPPPPPPNELSQFAIDQYIYKYTYLSVCLYQL